MKYPPLYGANIDMTPTGKAPGPDCAALVRQGGPGAPAAWAKKKPCRAGFFVWNRPALRRADCLAQLGFLVFDVLAGNGVEFLDHHFFRRVALVFGGGVEVTGACGRFEFDFLAYTFSHVELLVRCL